MGCGRWPQEGDYQEWNRSCSQPAELKLHSTYTEPTEYLTFTDRDYDKINDLDKALFEED
jgi:hypothetical protein